MHALRSFVQPRFVPLLLLMIAGGYAVILAELMITNHTEGIQLVGVIASALGIVLALVGMFMRGGAATAVAVVLIVLSLSGVGGVINHASSDDGGETVPPPLAPLSLAGLSLMGAVVVLTKPEEQP
jgi:hypothetical protein